MGARPPGPAARRLEISPRQNLTHPILILVVMATSILVGQPAAQQTSTSDPPGGPKDFPMQSILYDAEQLARSQSWAIADLRRELEKRGVTTSAEGHAHVRIVGRAGDPAIPASLVEAFGGESVSHWRYARSAWVPADRLTGLARALPEGYVLKHADKGVECAVDGEGPAVMNSAGYRDGGANGAGLTIAVFDGGWERLSAAQANGDAPQSPDTTNYCSGLPFESGGWHGTGCLEAIYDHCPGASYHLYKPADALVDLGRAVEDAIANGVDAFSFSIAFMDDWADDVGLACDAANHAGQSGMLFFTSAGNAAESHYQAFYRPTVGNPSWHDFSGTSDRYLEIIVPADATTKIIMLWDLSGGIYDYDLYLLDSEHETLRSSTSPGNIYEGLEWPNDTGADQTCYVVVRRVSGGITEFEMFLWGCSMQEYIVAWSSTMSPANSTNPNVIAIGAVDWQDYGAPNGSFVIESYSGRGPSNSGMLLPDLCGPTNVHSTSHPQGMGGTSNATPNAAGAACAFRSADLALSLDAIRWLLFEQAKLWKDWGIAGPDIDFGAGGMILYDYAPNTLWVSRVYGNVTNNRAFPLYTVAAAQSLAVPGGRILFFPGGNYPEPLTLNKELLYETAEVTAILGE